jgi:hypothetical protein
MFTEDRHRGYVDLANRHQHGHVPRDLGIGAGDDVQFHRAGWSVGDAQILTAAGPFWLVTRANGENVIEARDITQAVAWHRACQQAEPLGMLGRSTAK